MPGSVEKLEQSLKWLKLAFDEGPSVGGPHGPYLQVSGQCFPSFPPVKTFHLLD